jgi:YebC/PmpR family DNA-binding regulatory protein
MSGHSHWATIKRAKGAADAKRGKIFSKLGKEMTIVAKQGGGDPNSNPTLRTLIEKAKAAQMPNDNIDRAIKKGTGELESAALEEITYEGYAQGGVGIVVHVLTDNKNRAAAEVRNIFKKNGSDFAALGSVSRNFSRQGTIIVPAADGLTEDKLMEIALDAGADDMTADKDGFTVKCQPNSFAAVCSALEGKGVQIDKETSEVGLVPLTTVPVADLQVAKAVTRFVNALEDHEDVQDVYNNMDLDDAVAAQLEAAEEE